MQCPLCFQVLRYDEHLENLHLTPGQLLRDGEPVSGIWLACPECRAVANGTVYTPRRYPHGKPVPHHPKSDGDLPICGLCRISLRWDERHTDLRVPENSSGIKPGVYNCCNACVEQWKPAVQERLRVELGLNMDLASIVGDFLL